MDFWHFNTVAIIYIIATGISLVLAYFGWKMRPVRGTVLFTFMMLFVCVWIIAYTLGIYNNHYELKLIILRFEYIGMSGAVYLWVFFIARYTQLDAWVSKRMFIALAVIPAFTIINVFRAPNDTLIHQEYIYDIIDGISVYRKNYGWGFYLWTGYAYSMTIAGLIMLSLKIVQVSGSTKRQLYFLVPIVFIIIFPNILFITDNNFIAPYDPTPLTMVLVGGLFILSIFFYQFLDVVPVAHSMILKNVKAGVIIIDERAHIIEVNKVAEKIIGKAENQVLGKQIYKLLPEMKDIVKLDSIAKEIKAEKLLGLERKTYEIIVNPLIDKSKNILGQVIMLWDITEQKMALNELDSYARTVAHDLKSPLSNIMGFAELIVDENISKEEMNANLESIIISGEKMKSIIDGLLMLAKIRNVEKIDLSIIEVEPVITSVKQRLYNFIIQNNGTLQTPLSWHVALGNAIWIEEVWINLISNAIKYGGTPPKVSIGSELEGNFVKYWVKDNGHGLSDEERSVLFTEFTRIHPKRSKIKGYGIGLSIVERVVRKLNGEVGIESEPGKGSTFFFKLPKG